MNTLTKIAKGLLGKNTPMPAQGDALSNLVLPPAEMSGGMGLMDALMRRHSQRDFLPEMLSLQLLSNLVWATCGINRAQDRGRTAPSAINAQEVDLYLAMAQGLYLYVPQQHILKLVVAQDVRRVTGYQDFVDNAPLDLFDVADHSRMSLVPSSKRTFYCALSAGAMAQNAALYCASAGLSNVVRAWFNRHALASAMRLGPDHQLLVSQTVGYPKLPAA